MSTTPEAEAARAALEAWREEHPQATFDEIEDEVYDQLAALHAQWVGELAPPPDAAALAPPRAGDTGDTGDMGDTQERPRCRECGAALRPRGMRSRQVVTRMGATTTLTRRYWVCPACGAGHFPPG